MSSWGSWWWKDGERLANSPELLGRIYSGSLLHSRVTLVNNIYYIEYFKVARREDVRYSYQK